MKIKTTIALLLASGFIANAANFKVLDITMGQKRGTLAAQGLNCNEECCELFKASDPEKHYANVGQDGSVNGVTVCYTKADEVYKIKISVQAGKPNDMAERKEVLEALKRQKVQKGIYSEINYDQLSYGNLNLQIPYIIFIDTKLEKQNNTAIINKSQNMANSIANF